MHGAGRIMSRTQAAGRIRRRKRWECTARDCESVRVESAEAHRCPDHPDARAAEGVGRGAAEAGQGRLARRAGPPARRGIVLVGGGADEAPEVYKRLPDVLEAHAGSIRVKHTLRPLGVAMAGRDVHDPYKD